MPQNRQLRFGDLVIKITATGFWFGPQNQAVFGLSVASQNRQRELGVGHVSRSNSLLHAEASRVKVFQSGLLVEARLRVVHVVLSRRSRGVEAEDRWVDAMGCIRPFYPRITVFIVLGTKDIVVF
jgi:hypothetical protein